VRRFTYWRDPLFLTACAFYAVNRWLVKPHVHSPFIRGQFNDCLLIPCALPLVLWIHRRISLRQHDEFPSMGEILFHLVIWAGLCEGIGPHLMRTTGDVRDVAAYAVGGLLAWLWWGWQARMPLRPA
jgi:hypothetical protein